MNLYDRVKGLCSECGMSVMKLERDLGFQHGAFYKWKFFNPTTAKADRVAKYFGLELWELFQGVDLVQKETPNEQNSH